MTSKTSRTKPNISLILDKDFIQYCELNKIEDIEKLAKETFKRGFDLLKYGNIPMGEISSQDRGKVDVGVYVQPLPTRPEFIDSPPKKVEDPEVEKPEIIEATPLKSSDAREAFTKMGVVTKKKDEKKDLYGE